MRAWDFERRLGERRGSKLARCCWKEMRERAKEGKTGLSWERERGGNGLRIGDGGLRRWKEEEKKRVNDSER